jgi:Tfp pilus assembly protein PilN
VRELEFLPEDYIRARYHRRIGFIRSWLLLALGLAMVLWSLQMGKWVQDARAELQALRGTGYAAGVEVEKVEKLQAEQRAYQRRLGILQRFRPTGSVASLVAALADLVPDEVVLEEASLSGSEAAPRSPALRVAGWAPSEVLVTRTLGALEASPSLEGALLVESKPGANGNADRRYFVITVKVVDVPQPEENPGGTSPKCAQTPGR